MYALSGRKQMSLFSIIAAVTIFSQSCKKENNNSRSATTFTINCTGSFYVFDTMSFTSTAPASGTFLWNFGDGATSSLTTPTHVFSNTGTYNVTLIVNGDTSAINTRSVSISYGAERYARSYNWQGGYYRIQNVPGSSSHALNDTTFSITNINDSTFSVWGNTTVSSFYYEGYNNFFNINAFTPSFGPNLTITPDTIYFSKGENSSSYFIETSYFTLRH